MILAWWVPSCPCAWVSESFASCRLLDYFQHQHRAELPWQLLQSPENSDSPAFMAVLSMHVPEIAFSQGSAYAHPRPKKAQTKTPARGTHTRQYLLYNMTILRSSTSCEIHKSLCLKLPPRTNNVSSAVFRWNFSAHIPAWIFCVSGLRAGHKCPHVGKQHGFQYLSAVDICF